MSSKFSNTLQLSLFWWVSLYFHSIRIYRSRMRKLFDGINRTIYASRYLTLSNHIRHYVTYRAVLKLYKYCQHNRRSTNLYSYEIFFYVYFQPWKLVFTYWYIHEILSHVPGILVFTSLNKFTAFLSKLMLNTKKDIKYTKAFNIVNIHHSLYWVLNLFYELLQVHISY